MNFYSVAPFIEKYYPQYYSIETYPMEECVPIRKVSDEWGIFCNFARTPIQYEGVMYKSAEQLFQTMKFTDEEVRKKVYAANNPKMTAKHYIPTTASPSTSRSFEKETSSSSTTAAAQESPMWASI